MDAQEQILRVDGYELRITHPDKPLFPQAGITKRQLIDYYRAVAPYVLRYNRGRPLVFVRYPHGAPGYSFFQKNAPQPVPPFVEIHEMGKFKPTRYVVLQHLADLIWLVQLHALEFHVMGIRKPHWANPDLMVFDIDPPEGAGFAEIRDFALGIRPVIEKLGYTTLVKTSGKRGVHVVCPLEPAYTVDQVMEAAESIAREIMRVFPDSTLDVRKEKRRGKFLIDIYRNRAYQTFSMPYGTRATTMATVSMPLSWEQLRSLNDPHIFTIRNVPEILHKKGDAWANGFARASHLHTLK